MKVIGGNVSRHPGALLKTNRRPCHPERSKGSGGQTRALNLQDNGGNRNHVPYRGKVKHGGLIFRYAQDDRGSGVRNVLPETLNPYPSLRNLRVLCVSAVQFFVPLAVIYRNQGEVLRPGVAGSSWRSSRLRGCLLLVPCWARASSVRKRAWRAGDMPEP